MVLAFYITKRAIFHSFIFSPYLQKVCQLIERDVLAVIGVDLKSLDKQVASILNFFGLPFLQINPSLAWDNEQTNYNTSINLYPSRKVLSQAVIDIVNGI